MTVLLLTGLAVAFLHVLAFALCRTAARTDRQWATATQNLATADAPLLPNAGCGQPPLTDLNRSGQR